MDKYSTLAFLNFKLLPFLCFLYLLSSAYFCLLLGRRVQLLGLRDIRSRLSPLLAVSDVESKNGQTFDPLLNEWESRRIASKYDFKWITHTRSCTTQSKDALSLALVNHHISLGSFSVNRCRDAVNHMHMLTARMHTTHFVIFLTPTPTTHRDFHDGCAIACMNYSLSYSCSVLLLLGWISNGWKIQGFRLQKSETVN